MNRSSRTLLILAKLFVLTLCICPFARGKATAITSDDINAANAELKKEVEASIESKLRRADTILFFNVLQGKKHDDQRMFLVTDETQIRGILNSLKINPHFQVHTDSSGQKRITRLSKIFSLPELSLTFFEKGKEIGVVLMIDRATICGPAVAPDDGIFRLDETQIGKIYAIANKHFPGFIAAAEMGTQKPE